MKKWKLIRDNKNTIGGEENGENDKTGNKKIIENFLIGAGHPASDEI